MRQFRSTWLALVGGALLIALSVSAAFGADPADPEGNRGQTVAAFVHDLVFGSDTQTDEDHSDDTEESSDEQSEDTDESTDEEATDEEQSEDTEESTDASAGGDSATGAEHGACVSEEASDKTDETSEDGTHGAVVNEAARVTCWEPADADGSSTEEDTSETDAAAETAALSDKEQRKADRDAAKAEAKAARETLKAEGLAAREAWKASHTSGGGNGRGHGRP